MCISDRNRQGTNRLHAVACVLLLMFLAACHGAIHGPEDAPKEALQEALDALHEGDYDAYLQHVDWGMEMDSVQQSYMKMLLRQHQDWKRTERAAIVSIDVIDGKMNADSICTVYYQYTFADSTHEVVSQKMVRRGKDWKIRLRN